VKPVRKTGAHRVAAPVPLAHPAAWLVLAVFAGALALLVTHRLADPDLWQHLRVGRTIWERHAVPMTHEWTWPRFGEREVLPSWLFRALVWPFYAADGAWGLQIWRWLTTLGAFAMLALTARRLGARGLAPWLALLLCAVVYRQRSQVRPETLVAVLMSVQLLLLERWRSGDRRWLWALPALALVWANAHVSYWIGFAMTLLFALDHGWRERSVPRDLLLVMSRLRRRVALESVRLGRAVAAVRLPVAPEPRPAVSRSPSCSRWTGRRTCERTSHPGRRLAIARAARARRLGRTRWNGGCCCCSARWDSRRSGSSVSLRWSPRRTSRATCRCCARGRGRSRRGRGRPPCRRRR
jgi:hypothetical protein